jgi:hypothetical protein
MQATTTRPDDPGDPVSESIREHILSIIFSSNYIPYIWAASSLVLMSRELRVHCTRPRKHNPSLPTSTPVDRGQDVSKVKLKRMLACARDLICCQHLARSVSEGERKSIFRHKGGRDYDLRLQRLRVLAVLPRCPAPQRVLSLSEVDLRLVVTVALHR